MNAPVPHPYLADLPIFESEVESIAESIREVGLLHPITLDADGQVIGGRHRLSACEVAGVEPTFETWTGDALAFILADNATRKHQTTGQRAAENALSLASAGLRVDGRWKYGEVADFAPVQNSGFRSQVSRAGVVLDALGRDELVSVAAGRRDLKDAFRAAEQKRDAERQNLAEQERIEAEEADARKRLSELAPDYLERYQNARVAFAAWESDNRAAAAKERQAQAAEKARRDAEQQNAEDAARETGRTLAWLEGLAFPEHRQHLIEWWNVGATVVAPPKRELFNPARLREFAYAILVLADELEVQK